MGETVKTERDGRVMLVRLDNPPRNLMTGAMVDELDELTRVLEGDRSVGAVVLTGAVEGIFITHFDVAELVAGAEAVGMKVSPAMASASLRAVGAVSRVPQAAQALGRTPAVGLLELRQIHDVFMRMNRMEQVFIAAINGLALGGGCELTLACDLRLMASEEHHRIGLPELTLGIIPGAGGTQRLARALGPARALELMLEGRPLNAQEAVELGLVHRAVPSDRLLDEARTTAERLARRSPLTVGALKRAVYEGGSRSLPAGLHLERAGFMAAVSSEPALDAMRNYLDDLAGLSDRPPDDEVFAPWREGTRVRLTA